MRQISVHIVEYSTFCVLFTNTDYVLYRFNGVTAKAYGRKKINQTQRVSPVSAPSPVRVMRIATLTQTPAAQTRVVRLVQVTSRPVPVRNLMSQAVIRSIITHLDRTHHHLRIMYHTHLHTMDQPHLHHHHL